MSEIKDLNKNVELYLFLLNDDHNEIIEGHMYTGVELVGVDLTPVVNYSHMEIDSANYRKSEGGYNCFTFLYDTEEPIDDDKLKCCEALLSANNFNPDERCLDSEYYFFGFMTNRPSILSSELFDDFNAMLINQIVSISDINEIDDDLDDGEDDEYDDVDEEDDEEYFYRSAIENLKDAIFTNGKKILDICTTCTHSRDFYDNIERVVNEQ